MNAIDTVASGNTNAIAPMATIGRIRSARKGEIVLVYIDEDDGDSLVVRYDSLPGKCRNTVRWIAQDPLNVLDRVGARAQ